MEARVLPFLPIAVSPAPTTVPGTREVLKHLVKERTKGQGQEGARGPEEVEAGRAACRKHRF